MIHTTPSPSPWGHRRSDALREDERALASLFARFLPPHVSVEDDPVWIIFEEAFELADNLIMFGANPDMVLMARAAFLDMVEER